jgi:hypothetical protein
MNPLYRIAFVSSVLAVASCGGGSSAPPEPPAATFVFGVSLGPSQPPIEQFRVRTSSPAFIAAARAELQLPPSQRRLFPAGAIAAGDGGFNTGWSWHHESPVLTEAAIELCDGRPSMVEADLGYWLGTVKSFCPWAARVQSEN